MAANRFGEHALPPWQQPHRTGVKRHADEDEVENNSNISTQFKKLRINHAPRHPILAAHLASASTPGHTPSPNTISNGPPPPPTLPTGDFMPVDDAPHRIIIHDLDAEIAAIEAEEPAESNLRFPPDLDKKVSAIPDYILNPPREPDSNTQLVLYRDPISISIPESEDAVRKAIVEARRRTRERQAIERQEARVDVRRVEEPTPVQMMPEAKTWINGYNGSTDGPASAQRAPEMTGWADEFHGSYGHSGRSEAYQMDSSDHAPSHFYTVDEEDDPDAMDIG